MSDLKPYHSNQSNVCLSIPTNLGICSHLTTDGIDSETEIWSTSLKSEYYFLFHWPRITKSMRINFNSVWIFVTIPWIREATAIAIPANCRLCTPLIGYQLPVCFENSSRWAEHTTCNIMWELVENCRCHRLISDLLTDTQTQVVR